MGQIKCLNSSTATDGGNVQHQVVSPKVTTVYVVCNLDYKQSNYCVHDLRSVFVAIPLNSDSNFRFIIVIK